MSEAACPVLIMNEKLTLDSIENILYATNYHKEDIPSMKKLSELASIYDAEITALHITRDKDFDDRFYFRDRSAAAPVISVVRMQLEPV